MQLAMIDRHSIYLACHAGKHQNFMNLKSILVPNVDVDYKYNRFNSMGNVYFSVGCMEILISIQSAESSKNCCNL